MRVIKKIKVLIVDDSKVYREILSKALSDDLTIDVVATASDPFDARDKIIEFDPDVMTLDIEMPKMNGLDFLKKLMPQHPMHVIVTSSLSNCVFDAMNAGAVDFVAKPDSTTGSSMDSYINEIILKIKIASVAKLQHKTVSKEKTANSLNENAKNKIIAIGASTGGTEAILAVLKTLSKDIPGIVITQHMPAGFTKMYAQRLNHLLELNIKEAEPGDVIKPGCVLIAPGEYQMVVKKQGALYKVDCFKGEKVNGHCPSVDVLFNSVAESVKDRAIGVILTGMGGDGAKGLLAMRNNGARTIGQDESSCIVYGMPKVAYDIGAVEKQASLHDIGNIIYKFLND